MTQYFAMADSINLEEKTDENKMQLVLTAFHEGRDRLICNKNLLNLLDIYQTNDPEDDTAYPIFSINIDRRLNKGIKQDDGMVRFDLSNGAGYELISADIYGHDGVITDRINLENAEYDSEADSDHSNTHIPAPQDLTTNQKIADLLEQGVDDFLKLLPSLAPEENDESPILSPKYQPQSPESSPIPASQNKLYPELLIEDEFLNKKFVSQLKEKRDLAPIHFFTSLTVNTKEALTNSFIKLWNFTIKNKKVDEPQHKEIANSAMKLLALLEDAMGASYYGENVLAKDGTFVPCNLVPPPEKSLQWQIRQVKRILGDTNKNLDTGEPKTVEDVLNGIKAKADDPEARTKLWKKLAYK